MLAAGVRNRVCHMRWVIALLCVLGSAAGVAWLGFHRVYSDGRRVGYVQKLARQGTTCRTWEGEMALLSPSGTVGDRFRFTIPSEDVAQRLGANAGKLVALHYQQHKWTLNSCFGDTQYFVTDFRQIQ
jgi:hypothetical protein